MMIRRKGVYGLITIIDVTMGESFEFVATHQGYVDADAKIKEIRGMGHRVDGDLGKVADYFR